MKNYLLVFLFIFTLFSCNEDNNNEGINSLEIPNHEINNIVNTNNKEINSTNSTFVPNEQVIATFQAELLNHLKLADSINFTEARVIDYTLVSNDQGFS
ncbi:hypothetical protein [Mesonia aquimarina]|uniref:hypothetical protein n=1 Tax=Mesonia aquimarina TaxID=1504967 RepID=UPI000EF5BE9A|nr:hypothetical protein [Mesonia aquimarina]